MKNYICINGNKTELTEEQLKQLGIELPKANPFDRNVSANNNYYTIDSTGEVFSTEDMHHSVDIKRYRIANYCTDASLLEQRALHETLSRLLWRYSMEHDGDKIDWKNTAKYKWYIFYDTRTNQWKTGGVLHSYDLGEHFNTKEIAENAIEEIIKPFLAAHPKFKF